MIKEEHNEEDSVMGDQEKTSNLTDFIMGQVIHFLHFFF
jgi:hypothetical protein